MFGVDELIAHQSAYLHVRTLEYSILPFSTLTFGAFMKKKISTGSSDTEKATRWRTVGIRRWRSLKKVITTNAI